MSEYQAGTYPVPARPVPAKNPRPVPRDLWGNPVKPAKPRKPKEAAASKHRPWFPDVPKLDLYGEPIPCYGPRRHMNHVEEWEDAGGVDEEFLDMDIFHPLPEPLLADPADYPTSPFAQPVKEIEISEFDAAQIMTGKKADGRVIAKAKAAVLTERHKRHLPLHLPGDHVKTIDVVEGVTRLLAEMARLQLNDIAPIRPPVIQVSRRGESVRYRLRRWQGDPTDTSSRICRNGWSHRGWKGKWISLGSYPTRDAAEEARFAWLRKHSDGVIELDEPSYLAQLVPGVTQSNAVGAGRGDGFFAA